MIHSIYVKSYLLPDKKRDSKRKTEEVKVDTSEGHVHWRRRKTVGVQHVFTPACFKFSRHLEYSGITNEHIKEKTLQIEVCITQRYSHRSFLIGMVQMSLKSAVKKLVKEKIPLIPCMNHTLPTNMKVYSASDLNVMHNTPGGDIFFSYPNVRITLPEDADDASDKAASNPDLHRSPCQLNSPSMEVDMDSHFRFVPKLDFGSGGTLDESGYSSEFHVSIPSELESPDSNSSLSNASNKVKLADSSALPNAHFSSSPPKSTLEGISEEKLPSKKQHTAIEVVDIDEEDLNDVTVETSKDLKVKVKDPEKKKSAQNLCNKPEEITEKFEVKVDPNTHLESRKDKKRSSRRSNRKRNEGSSGSSRSRSQSPEWDFYDIPTEVVAQSSELPESPWKEGAAPVVLPMETTMGLAHSKDKDKSIRRSKKKYLKPSPGGAVPLVPQIVVTRPSVKDKSGNKVKGLQESIVIGMPESKADEIELKEYNRTEGGEVEMSNSGGGGGDDNDLKSCKVEKPALRKIDRKSFVNVGKVMTKKESDNSEQKDKNKDKVEGESKLSKFKSKFKKLTKGKDPERTVVFDKDVSKISDIVIETDLTSVKVDKLSETPVVRPKVISKQFENKPTNQFKSKQTNQFKSMEQTGSKSTQKQQTGSSVYLDMEKLSLQASGAHVIELIEEDISITELGDDDLLFTERSEAPSLGTFTDIEVGLEHVAALTRCVSPTQYMVPVHVYQEDDTSCDESVAYEPSYKSMMPTTEL